MQGTTREKPLLSALTELCEKMDAENADALIAAFDVLNSVAEKDMSLTKELEETAMKLQNKLQEMKKEQEAAEKRQKTRQTYKDRQREHIQKVTSMDLPMDFENCFAEDYRTEGVHAETVSDGLILSLANLGKVDIEYISAITGEDYKTVITGLKGSIYQNPEAWDECFYKGWESADEYLSGNLGRKLRIACDANCRYAGYFSDNVEALKDRMPPHLCAEDIYITLGSPWVPEDIIDEFIEYLFGKSYYSNTNLKTKHDSITGSWEIPEKSRYYYNVKVTKTYGTSRMGALYILEHTLNMKTVSVSDPVAVSSSKTKWVLNPAETVLALEKQQKLIDEFQKWVWKDEERKNRLLSIYERHFCYMKRRRFDGSYLTFPDMNEAVSLYPYQKNAVARILFSPNTLLAHDVGAGKTYVMIAAGMELRRMGLSGKNLYVVPNNIVGQWKNLFHKLYPTANVLCVDPRSFTPDKRTAVLEQIRDGDQDAIIMAYSCFDSIPLSRQYYEDQLTEQLEKVGLAASKESSATSRLCGKQKKLKKALSELVATAAKTIAPVCFDELPITRLFVDEAHNYKNVPIETKINHVLGISGDGSKKCREMMDKCRLIQKRNGGGGVVLATGTPVTNSLTDLFVMQQYLQSGALALLDLQNFDSWIGMFAERSTEFEVDVDTGKFRLATRFSKFHNLPELTALLSEIADFHSAEGSAELPAVEGYTDALIPKTDELKWYLDDISARADAVRARGVSRKDDNMLLITTDGRKAALDLRLVENTAAFSPDSKVAHCAENVAGLYYKTMPERLTQLVFCDTSTPKAGFNMYDELRSRLSFYGVDEEEIAYIHDATTEKERDKLFSKVRKGEIRILIGSTFKLGLGVNIQDKLVALHHLDVPWRPADMIQREGRILRQGNQNEKVQIFRYITEGSFDAYSWQLLETKARFIETLLSGSMAERSGSDVDGTSLGYAEVKALAIGNPKIKERVETANELSRLRTLSRKDAETREQMRQELSLIPRQKEEQSELIRKCGEDMASFEKYEREHPKYPQNSKWKRAEAARRKEVRNAICTAIHTHSREKGEQVILRYHDFDVGIPAGFVPETPRLLLCGAGRYTVELGEAEIGYLARIDNFLSSLGERKAKMENGLAELYKREEHIRAELAKEAPYTTQITEMEHRLARLDKELGVEQ